MEKLDLNQIHEYQLGCLKYFDEVCKKNNLKYSLAYGSLLGAVRHGGFIPWDDDVDVMMLREDFDKFENLFLEGKEKADNYHFISNRNNKSYYYTIGRICDKRTIMKFTKNEHDVSGMGIFIDIYPFDGFPGGKVSFKIFDYVFRLFNGYLGLINSKEYVASRIIWKDIIKRMIWNIGKVVGYRFVFCLQKQLLLTWRRSNNIYDVWDNFGYVIPRSWFSNMIEIEFSSLKVKCIANYDEFLTKQYGDYMKLPPENKRVSTHDYEAFLI